MRALGFFQRGFGTRDRLFALLALFFPRGQFLLVLSTERSPRVPGNAACSVSSISQLRHRQ